MTGETLYKRKTREWLLAIRCIAFILFFISIYLLSREISDYAVFTVFFLITLFCIPLTQIVITNSGVFVSEFFMLGLLVKRHEITIQNILCVTRHEDTLSLPEEYSSVDTLVTKISYTDPGNSEKNLNIKLKAKEYSLVWKVLNEQT